MNEDVINLNTDQEEYERDMRIEKVSKEKDKYLLRDKKHIYCNPFKQEELQCK